MKSATVTERRGLIVLRAAWLFDSTSAILRANPVITLDGSTVAAVGYGMAPPEEAGLVDLDGATLLPGLIDTHVHLAFDASRDPVASLAARDDSEALAAMTAAACTGTQGARAAVCEHAERGVDVIKIMASGGTMTPRTCEDRAQFSAGGLRAAVEEAHRHGLPVTAHAHGTQAIADAAAGGADGIEHVSFWCADGVGAPPSPCSAGSQTRASWWARSQGSHPPKAPSWTRRRPGGCRTSSPAWSAFIRPAHSWWPAPTRDSHRSGLTMCRVTPSPISAGSASARPRPCKRSPPSPRGSADWRTARATSPPAMTPTSSPSTATPLPAPAPSTTSAPSTPGPRPLIHIAAVPSTGHVAGVVTR